MKLDATGAGPGNEDAVVRAEVESKHPALPNPLLEYRHQGALDTSAADILSH